MNKKIRMIVALLLAAVTVLALPLSAVAITYSGGYGGVNYVATANGSSSMINNTVTTDTPAILTLDSVAGINVTVNNQVFFWGTYHSNSGVQKNKTYYNGSYSYSSLALAPNAGFFFQCVYNDTVNAYKVIDNITLSF